MTSFWCLNCKHTLDLFCVSLNDFEHEFFAVWLVISTKIAKAEIAGDCS